LLKTARLFAQLDIAEADAAIVCWDAKFAYNFWRPVTSIRNAGSDGNDQTTADPTWEPLLVTPPFPSYTSGHSTFSGAAGTVLAAYFGADRSFSTLSDDGTITRSFASFAQAADEAGMSRIYGGIHYQSDNVSGLACGRAIAAYDLANLLQSG
jgi:membrane-associated phospholipid phosphatase